MARPQKETTLQGKVYMEKTRDGTRVEVQGITYDNTTSGLAATTIQDAIDETAQKVNLIGDKYVRTSRFEIISAGTSGAVTLPANSTVVLDDFGGTVDAILSKVASGKPTFESPLTAGSVVVSTTFDGSGNYVLSGTPSAYPIAIIYRVQQQLKVFDSTAVNILGDPEQTSATYIAEDVANKSTSVVTDQASNTKYPSVKAVYDWAVSIFEPVFSILSIAKGGTNNNTYTTNGVVYFDGTKLTTDDGHFTFNATTNVVQTGTATDGINLGGVDAFGRTQMWNYRANALLRLGALGQDGDFGDVNSEGIVVYGPNSQGAAINSATGNFGYARVKADRIGLLTSINNTQLYYFRADPTELYLKSDAGTKVFTVTRSSGAIQTSLGTGLVRSDASGNLTSSAMSSGDVTGALGFTPANINSPSFTGTPSLPTGTTGTTQSDLDNSTKLSTTAYADNRVASAISPLAKKSDIQVFTSSGTWIKPAGTNSSSITRIYALGAGGGGGSGRKGAAGTIRCGGGGGAGGALVKGEFFTSTLGSTETVTIGAGGSGGASQTSDSTSGISGVTGGDTLFGIKLKAVGGTRGTAGSATSGAGGSSVLTAASAWNFIQLAGASANTSGTVGANSVTSSYLSPTGGAAGGGVSAADAVANGGSGGVISSLLSDELSVAGGTAQTGAPPAGNGNNSSGIVYGQSIGTGGGGGRSSITGNAGYGGNGGIGAGGGGGGASVDATGDSGAGGDGGSGWLVAVTTY